MSKGSARRPTQVSREVADANYVAAFGESRLDKMLREQREKEEQQKKEDK